MENNKKLKYQICTYINDYKNIHENINCMLALNDGRFAVGSDDLKIYNDIFFTLDLKISSKQLFTNKFEERMFFISKLMYLKNENILIKASVNFYIIKIVNKEKKYYFIQKFKPTSVTWVDKIIELSNNSIVTIGVNYSIEFFSKNEKNEYFTSKVIKDAHKRDGHKTFIEIPNDKIISFSGKLREFKVWDLINYKCIFQNYINFDNYHIISLILKKYVLICCDDGLTIIDLNNNYTKYLVMKSISPNSIIKLNEIEFLITNKENIIMKIKFNEDKLKFEVIDSQEILLKKDYFLGDRLIKIKNNYYITHISKKFDIDNQYPDETLLIFQYLNN